MLRVTAALGPSENDQVIEAVGMQPRLPAWCPRVAQVVLGQLALLAVCIALGVLAVKLGTLP